MCWYIRRSGLFVVFNLALCRIANLAGLLLEKLQNGMIPALPDMLEHARGSAKLLRVKPAEEAQKHRNLGVIRQLII